MLSANRNQSLLDLHSLEDPSLSSHLNTIQTENRNLPRLKYSLACISNTLAYNNSNRLYNIASISRPQNFSLIVNLLINYQDQKILEESLFILNVLLNEGNDLTIKQENDIMHSLSYVKVNTQQEKGFISDKLAQEILVFSYKVKTKHQLSQFIASLLSQKMSGAQAKKFTKELKKQQLKNISISNLIRIGMKFKASVVLMSQILNLIYEKVLAGKDQHEIKDLFEFLPKIVEQNMDEQSISYKCLQIFKTIENSNNKNKFDPLITRYLESLLKYKKDLFLPLKRQYVSTPDEFIKILQFGKQFQIYHMLLLDYLVKNGFRSGKQSWKHALEANITKKNLKIKQFCLRLSSQDKHRSEPSKTQVTQSEQMDLIQTLPIEALGYASTTLQKLLSEPSISNSLYVIKSLCYYRNSQELLLTIHRIALKQKEFYLVEQIEKLVKESFTEQFVYDQMKNITKVKHKIVLKGQLYFIWLPILLKNQKLLQSLESQLVEIMGYESIQIEDKFYVIEYLLENKIQKPVNKFLLYLNRQLESLSSIEEDVRQQGNVLFLEIKHYLRKWAAKIKQNTDLISFYSTQLLSNLERTSELLFSKLVEFKSEQITGVLFELQKWDFYGQNWKQPYRWILTALQEISEQTPLYTLDCLELFQMSIENIPDTLIPPLAKDRFIKLVYKNWQKFQSEHLFAIERIVQMLWENHQYPILKQLSPIPPVSELIFHQNHFNTKNEYFFQSEHPTSNWLINLQMSHFFGVISQDQFVRLILQLYDKRYSEVKRFTEKNVISLMNFIIWIYQYSQEDMQKGLSDMILAFLGYKAEGANQISSYNIRKKCIQIVAVVSHSINLLKLPIKELLQAYIGEPTVLKNLNEIIQTIIESKPSFFSQLHLEPIIQSIMLSLITLEDLPLIEEYINFIEAVCYIENSQYPELLENSIPTLYQILKVQFKIVQKYRKNLVSFILDLLQHYQFKSEDEILWFLMNKYFVEENIQLTILESLISNNQNKTFKLNFSNQKLLVRLIMHHNENQQIIQMVQQILTNSEKQSSVHLILQSSTEGQNNKTKQKNEQKKQETAMNPEDQFMLKFKQQNYGRCQELLPEIRNPFMKIRREDIKEFLGLRELSSYENLLIFIANNPTTRNELMSIEQFYLREECLPFIYKMVEHMTWGSESLERIKIKEFDGKSMTLKTELNSTDQLIKNTVSSLFQRENLAKVIIDLLRSIKVAKQQVELLAFYSKCISPKNQKLLHLIVKEMQMEEGVDVMRLDLDWRVQNPSQASCQILLYHLFVHLQTFNSTQPSDFQAHQNYIKQIVPLICPQEMMKTMAVSNQFFISLSTKLSQKLNSQIILRQLTDLCYRFMMIFEASQGISGAKNIELKLYESTALISALLFLLKNNDNVYAGPPGKTLTLLQTKIQLYPILKDAYDYIISNKDKFALNSQKTSHEPLSVQQKPSLSSSTLTNAIKAKNQLQTSHKPSSSVVYAREITKDEQPESERQNEVSEAFKKGKELQPYMSIVSRQPKPIAEQFQTIKSSNSVQSIELSIQQADQQSLIRPKEAGFDTNNFNQLQSPVSSQQHVTDKERSQLVNIIKSKQNEQISIATLKEHSKFIASLLDYQVATSDQIEELMKSIDNITSTVNEHHYYVKKLIELEVPFKLINLFKRKDTFIPHQKQNFKLIFESKLLKLHHAMSYKKQKKTIVFDDELTIQFFKFILQKSLANKHPRAENSIIVEIVTYCIKSIDSFFKQGLISMFIELLKMDQNTQDFLKFFSKIQLNKHLIFQIYQRGLLDKFAEVFSPSQTVPSTAILNLWIKLAGKICTTSAIQDKYVQKNIHKLVWKKHLEHLSNDIESKKNLAFFFAYLGKKSNKVFEFMVQNQVLQKLLASLHTQNSQQLYLLFYNTLAQNKNALEYSFRIKYHLHLIEKINKPPQKPKSKFFYKSLGQIMSSKQHQSLFFKEQIILALINEYNVKSEPSIYECLLDFIVTLENDKEFQQLKKQQFWTCLSLFEYKLSSQATYAYILQIFLVMIKKGRIKQFNTAEIRGKVTLKAEYSINLQGKQLALRFITALSLKTKECYITERCIRLLSSLVGFKVTSNELDIIEDILDVEGMLENFQFFSFCYDYEITHAICNRFKNFNDAQLLSALKILNILGTQSKNNKVLRDKLLMPVMDMLKAKNQKPLNNLIEEWLFKVILITVSYRQNNQIIQKLSLGAFMIQILPKILLKDPKERAKILNQYVTIIEMCRQNSMIPLVELQKILQNLNKAKIDKEVSKILQIKQSIEGMVANEQNILLTKMMEGVKANLYKSDGSSSELILYLTDDKLELNCAEKKGAPVKQKWRIVLSEITEMVGYNEENEYQTSAFYRAGGLFSKAPDRRLCLTVKSKSNELNVMFYKKEEKENWKKYIEFGIQNSKKILKQFK